MNIPANAKTAETVQPIIRAFDNPSIDTQVTAMGRSTLGQLRIDTSSTQVFPFLLIIIAPIPCDFIWPLPRMAGLPSYGWHSIHQGSRLVGVGNIGRCGPNDQRHTL